MRKVQFFQMALFRQAIDKNEVKSGVPGIGLNRFANSAGTKVQDGELEVLALGDFLKDVFLRSTHEVLSNSQFFLGLGLCIFKRTASEE
mgnify:CR=1 FL=1